MEIERINTFALDEVVPSRSSNFLREGMDAERRLEGDGRRR